MNIQILSTSDVHGYFVADDYRRPLRDLNFGLAKTLTVIDRVRHDHPADLVLTIDNGDFIQGSPLTNYIEKKNPDQDRVYGELAQPVGYDVRILGNHEFNYGRQYLEKLFATDPILLNANIIDRQTGQPFIGQPYKIFEKMGVKVAVIGLTTQYIPHWEAAENIQGLRFLDPVEVAKDLIKKLVGQVDRIVLAYHGGFDRDLQTDELLEPETVENQGNQLLALAGVDALVTGHQHRMLAEVVHGVATTQPGYRGQAVGWMTISDDGNQATLLSVEGVGASAELTNQINDLYQQTNRWLDQPIGHVGHNLELQDHFSARLHGHPFADLINQIQMAATGAKISTNAIFSDEMQGFADKVTLRDVATNYIYPNTLAVELLSGAELKEALEINAAYFAVQNQQIVVNQAYVYPKVQHYNYDLWSGLTYTMTVSKPVGERISAISVDGQPLDLTAKYEVVVNNYRANGAGNAVFSPDKIIRELPTDVTELISDYLLAHPNLNVGESHNVNVVL